MSKVDVHESVTKCIVISYSLSYQICMNGVNAIVKTINKLAEKLCSKAFQRVHVLFSENTL